MKFPCLPQWGLRHNYVGYSLDVNPTGRAESNKLSISWTFLARPEGNPRTVFTVYQPYQIWGISIPRSPHMLLLRLGKKFSLTRIATVMSSIDTTSKRMVGRLTCRANLEPAFTWEACRYVEQKAARWDRHYIFRSQKNWASPKRNDGMHMVRWDAEQKYCKMRWQALIGLVAVPLYLQ